MLFLHKFDAAKASVFESLLLHETTNFRVTGENIPLNILIVEAGIKGLEELIEQNGLAFTHWTNDVMSFVNPIEGVIPISPAKYNSKTHTDPEESISSALNMLADQPNKRDKRLIIRKTRDLYSYPPDDLATDAVTLATSAFNSNKFHALGLDSTKCEITNLSAHQVSLLAECCNELLQYKFLASSKFTTSDSTFTHKIFLDCTQKIKNSDISEAFSKILILENFPKTQDIYQYTDSPIRKSIKLRNNKNVIRFRTWLHEALTQHEIEEITKAYLDAITSKKGFLASNTGKFTKTVFMASAGALVGAALGPIGMAAGGVVGSLLAPAGDLAFDLVDEYYLSNLLSGWSPRMVFDDLRSLGIRIEPTLDS
ncbi:hypothetical protein [Phytopseudomonas argentinensis]|nr:hypothetical protein [Pseudomonas argentinensis]